MENSNNKNSKIIIENHERHTHKTSPGHKCKMDVVNISHAFNVYGEPERERESQSLCAA